MQEYTIAITLNERERQRDWGKGELSFEDFTSGFWTNSFLSTLLFVMWQHLKIFLRNQGLIVLDTTHGLPSDYNLSIC